MRVRSQIWIDEITFWSNRSFVRSFIHSFVHWFVYSFIHSFIHSKIHSKIHSFIHSFKNSFIQRFIYSFGIYSLVFFIYSFVYLFIHLRFYWFTISFIKIITPVPLGHLHLREFPRLNLPNRDLWKYAEQSTPSTSKPTRKESISKG